MVEGVGGFHAEAAVFDTGAEAGAVEPDPRWKELTRTGLERRLKESLLVRGRFIELADVFGQIPVAILG